MIEHIPVISTEGRNLIFKEENMMSNDKVYFVYLLTNWNNKVIYAGVTNDLERRIYEHKHKLIAGFTNKYNINKLVYYEETGDVEAAITREKQIKKWRREKKNYLVEGMNPNWVDLCMDSQDFSHSLGTGLGMTSTINPRFPNFFHLQNSV